MVSKSLVQHKLTSKALGIMQFWLFDFPMSFLTFASTLLAFGGSLIDIGIDTNILAGGSSALVVMLQTMNKVCNFGSRSDMHYSTAIDMRDFRGDLILTKHKLIFKERQDKKEASEDFTIATDMMGNESDDSDSYDHKKGKKKKDPTFSMIQSRYLQILTGCKSYVPIEVSEAFNELDSALMLAQSKENFGLLDTIMTDVDVDDFIYSQAYEILAGEIVRYRYYPLLFPDSSTVVKQAMERLRLQMKDYSRYWDLREPDVETGCC